MKINNLFFIAVIFALTLFSCSKKTVPAANTEAVIKKDTLAAAVKVPVKKKLILPIPKVIAVNDVTAKKTPDGRYYYDLEGRRYWRNNKDGKYYLFNKAMYKNDAFKP